MRTLSTGAHHSNN